MNSRHMTLFSALMLVASVVMAQEAVIPHVFSSGDTISASQMNENFSAIASAAVSSNVWHAERTGAVEFTSGLAWTVIPGMSIDAVLDRSALVVVLARGSQRVTGATAIHTSYRFTIDGAAGGDPTFGEQILMVDASVYWDSWSLMRVVALAPGAHTFTADVSAASGDGVVCGEAGGTTPQYASGQLVVMAFYQ